jgi:hypothetical protein
MTHKKTLLSAVATTTSMIALYAFSFRFYILAYAILAFITVFVVLPMLLLSREKTRRTVGNLLLASFLLGSAIALYWEEIGLPNW